MLKHIQHILFTICAAFSLAACNNANGPKIGVIVPIEHQAMDDIVAGLKDGLKAYPKPFNLQIKNAQNDMILERAIIQEMQAANYTIIAPIGIAATKMTMSMVQNKPIVGIAAKMNDEERHVAGQCHTSIVQDEIPIEKIIQFISTTFPQIKQVTLIYSPDDKIYPDVKAASALAKARGIQIKPLLAMNLSELYAIASAIPATSQAILVLKDNMIVSGIGTLTKVAALRHIPLITSDQGSAAAGADIALGVPEKQIGELAAKQIIAILDGKAPCSLPIVKMQDLTIFINSKALTQTKTPIDVIKTASQKLGYPIQDVAGK